MKRNVGRLDQLIRMGISLVFIYIGFIDKEIIQDSLSSNIIGTIGVIFLIVAATRSCPIYAVAGINTDKSEEQ